MNEFSIIIPTWKNLPYLQLACRGLRHHSAADHEVIIFFNEFDEACREWVRSQPFRYLVSPVNLGVCTAVNQAVAIATRPYICFLNDDMYPLPGWDTALDACLGLAPKLWLSGTAIEANPRCSPCYIGGHDYGRTPATFQEDRLLAEFATLRRPYNVVSTWTPILLRREDWDAIGGFDEAYFPGTGSDPDLAMKMWQQGCRHFIGVGTSLVYHFSRATMSRFDDRCERSARAYFRKKWGVSRKRFLCSILHRDEVITPSLLAHLRATP